MSMDTTNTTSLNARYARASPKRDGRNLLNVSSTIRIDDSSGHTVYCSCGSAPKDTCESLDTDTPKTQDLLPGHHHSDDMDYRCAQFAWVRVHKAEQPDAILGSDRRSKRRQKRTVT